MATEESRNVAAADDADDALPMNRTSPTALIVAGAAVVVVAGLLIFALSGGDSAEPEAKDGEANAAPAGEALTKEELKERQEHIKRTQAALAAADQEERAEGASNPSTTAAPGAGSKPTAKSPAPAGAKSPSAPAKKPANTKKSMDSLDAFGSDITSQLK